MSGLGEAVNRAGYDLGALRIFDPDYPEEPVVAAGARTVNIPDTVGYSVPDEYARLIGRVVNPLGVPLDAFTLAVSAADDDDEVAAFLREQAPRSKYATWNAVLCAREPRGGNRAEALTVYPWLAERPDLVLVLDVLEEDDKRSFSATR